MGGHDFEIPASTATCTTMARTITETREDETSRAAAICRRHRLRRLQKYVD